jgi:hypothetical protein
MEPLALGVLLAVLSSPLPIPTSADHAQLMATLTVPNALLTPQPATWDGGINLSWASPITVNVWTALLLDALMRPERMIAVEARLARFGLPEEGVGTLSSAGLLWLLAHGQEDPFSPAKALWQTVREQLKPLTQAEAALDDALTLLGTQRSDPWGLKASLYTRFMQAWRQGDLATPESGDDPVVRRFLASPLTFWNNWDVPTQAFRFAEEQPSPHARLRSLATQFSAAPRALFAATSSLDIKTNLIQHMQAALAQGATLDLDTEAPDTLAFVAELDPALFAQMRATQSVTVSPALGRRNRLRS